jgi:hypothetical protein
MSLTYGSLPGRIQKTFDNALAKHGYEPSDFRRPALNDVVSSWARETGSPDKLSYAEAKNAANYAAEMMDDAWDAYAMLMADS